jgi:lipopolysaccharide export system permease protein
MFQFKRLDRFMLQSFMPLFVMTFLICTFIVLMQFLWMHLNDLVGKGLGMDVLGELFFYAALSMVPMALPLAVLLASLMTFGNLGESFELTALKAGGISLFRVMRPLIYLMIFVAVGAFFFQNNVLPVSQSRMWTLLKSMREKTPELDIVEGEFNYQLSNINIFVSQKNRETGVMYDVVIYDLQNGFERSRVILADSATLVMTPDRTHLKLSMHTGELFENLREASGSYAAKGQLYRREQFKMKEILVPFDANFTRKDDSDMRSLYIGKNVAQLSHSIDSINAHLDSIGNSYGRELATQEHFALRNVNKAHSDSLAAAVTAKANIDSIFSTLDRSDHRRYLNNARMDADRQRMDFIGRSLYMNDENQILRRHGIELFKKFTLSLACIIFFFIGAPLGAIIRKGGLGTPLVISVFLFIFYYIIDNTGMKMAKDGKVAVWEGVWLSSAVLLPLGIFVTYKAVHDSAVFNPDVYKNLWRQLMNKEQRTLTAKEVVIEEVEPQRATAMLAELQGLCADFLTTYPARRQSYVAYWRGGYSSDAVRAIIAQLEWTVSYLSNTRRPDVLAAANKFPVAHNFRILHPAPHSKWSTAFCWFVPLGIPAWAVGVYWQRKFRRKVVKITEIIPTVPVNNPTATTSNTLSESEDNEQQH